MHSLCVCVQLLKEAIAHQAEVKDDAHVAAFAQLELASVYVSTPEVPCALV